jgi:hypothetical protein
LLESHEDEVKRLNIIFDDRSEKEKYFQNEHYNEFRQKVWVNYLTEHKILLLLDIYIYYFIYFFIIITIIIIII